MLTYRVIVLGSFSQGDREFKKVNCDRIRYERDCIVFEQKILGEWTTVMSVPQIASIVELDTLKLNE